MSNPKPNSFAKLVAPRWIWVLEIIFGATATLGFQKLLESVRAASAVSPEELIAQLFVAICLYGFFLYDVMAVHMLNGLYPYQQTRYSTARYFLDIIMAFLLLMMLIPGMERHPENSVMTILIALTLWHLGAFVWHLLAQLEKRREQQKLNWKQFRPHLGYAVLYWLVFAIWYALEGQYMTPLKLQSPIMLYALCATVLVVAIHRLGNVMKLCSDDPEDAPTST